MVPSANAPRPHGAIRLRIDLGCRTARGTSCILVEIAALAGATSRGELLLAGNPEAAGRSEAVLPQPLLQEWQQSAKLFLQRVGRVDDDQAGARQPRGLAVALHRQFRAQHLRNAEVLQRLVELGDRRALL